MTLSYLLIETYCVCLYYIVLVFVSFFLTEAMYLGSLSIPNRKEGACLRKLLTNQIMTCY